MKTPKRINLQPEELDALLKRVKNGSLQAGDYEIIKAMAETIEILSRALDDKNTSIKLMLRMLFGANTEKTKNVLKKLDEYEEYSGNTDATDTSNTPTPVPEESRKNKQKGHGRNGASAYTGANKVTVSHSNLKSGDPCPECQKGKVYEISFPGVVVRVVGKPPIQATVYELQKLRCNLCGEVFTAGPPAHVGNEKYDETSGAMIALLKYGSRFPFNRLEWLQASLGIPIAGPTQWDIVEGVANRIHPCFNEK